MDCIDLRKYLDDNNGYCWILNVIDTFTKYLWLFKLKDKSAVTIKNCLQYIFDNFGDPLEIQSDNGKEFKNCLLREFLLGRNIKIIHGRPRNPKAQGQVERVNQTIKRRFSKSLKGSVVYCLLENHPLCCRCLYIVSDLPLLVNGMTHNYIIKFDYSLLALLRTTNSMYKNINM